MTWLQFLVDVATVGTFAFIARATAVSIANRTRWSLS
jgi:hypothetical protein